MNKRNSAQMSSCAAPSEPRNGCNGFTVSSNSNYNTNVKSPVKAQESAETMALHLLREWGYEAIQSPDWLGRKDGKWVCLEAKGKEVFEAGKNFPHDAIGLNLAQLHLRTQLLKDWGVRTILVNFVPETDVFYYAFLDELEKGISYDSPGKIRLYPVSNFSEGKYGYPLPPLTIQFKGG
jgi:hypothetical protein